MLLRSACAEREAVIQEMKQGSAGAVAAMMALTAFWLWLLFGPAEWSIVLWYWPVVILASIVFVSVRGIYRMNHPVIPPIGNDRVRIETTLLTVGGARQRCAIVLAPEYLVIDTGHTTGLKEKMDKWESGGKQGKAFDFVKNYKQNELKIPLVDITGFLFEQRTVLTGFGIDYRDADGTARLMFINDGEFQENRTRTILKLIQDTFVAMTGELSLEPPAITDITANKKKAESAVVHRVKD